MLVRNAHFFLVLILFLNCPFFLSAQSGAALDFDGVNDYVNIPNSNSLNLSKVTIETWIKLSSTAQVYNFICGKNFEQLEIHTNPAGGIRFIPVNYVYLDGPSGILPYDTWTHIALVYDPSAASAKLYVNGIEKPLINQGSLPLSTPIVSNTSPFSIGRRTNNSYYFKGALDEFRIWNRALNQAEIQSHMNCGLSGTQTNLSAYYKFNQGLAGANNSSNTSLADSSGNGNNGTLNNFALNGNASTWIANGAIPNSKNCAIPIVYTFNGNGNWSDSLNWAGKLIPPKSLDSGTHIIINPVADGVCIVDTLQFIPQGSRLTFLGNKKMIIRSDLYLTDSSDKNTPSKKVKVLFGNDVPELIKQLADSICTPLSIIKARQDSIVDIINYKEEGMFFALNSQKEILLISMANKQDTIVYLDAKQSAVALVRLALNPSGTGAYNPSQLNLDIQAAQSFQGLQSTIHKQLNNGKSIFSSDSVLQQVRIVINELMNPSAGLVQGNKKILGQSKYYFLENILLDEYNLYFEDIVGAEVKFFNQTRLFWQLTVRDGQGVVIGPSTDLEWYPFKFQLTIEEIKPKTILVTKNANNTDKFSLTIEQNLNTRTKHCLYLIQSSLLTLLEWFGKPGAPYEKELGCTNAVANAILNEKLPGLLTDNNGDAAIDYIAQVLPEIEPLWFVEKFKACGIELPGLEDFVSTKGSKRFLKTLLGAWSKIQLIASIAGASSFTYQMANYWNYSATQHFCKVEGVISKNCPPTISTKKITSISSNRAISGGNIIDEGVSPITVKGVCWSTTTNPTIESYKTINGSGIDSFSSEIQGLNELTKYYVRAYATNAVGTSYGNLDSFTTTKQSFKLQKVSGDNQPQIMYKTLEPFTVKLTDDANNPKEGYEIRWSYEASTIEKDSINPLKSVTNQLGIASTNPVLTRFQGIGNVYVIARAYDNQNKLIASTSFSFTPPNKPRPALPGTYVLQSYRTIPIGGRTGRDQGYDSYTAIVDSGRFIVNNDLSWTYKLHLTAVYSDNSRQPIISTFSGTHRYLGETAPIGFPNRECHAFSQPTADWINCHCYCSYLQEGNLYTTLLGGYSVMSYDGTTYISTLDGQTVWKRQ